MPRLICRRLRSLSCGAACGVCRPSRLAWRREEAVLLRRRPATANPRCRCCRPAPHRHPLSCAKPCCSPHESNHSLFRQAMAALQSRHCGAGSLLPCTKAGAGCWRQQQGGLLLRAGGRLIGGIWRADAPSARPSSGPTATRPGHPLARQSVGTVHLPSPPLHPPPPSCGPHVSPSAPYTSQQPRK